VTSLAGLEAVFARLPRRAPVWCRVRSGSGSMGALPVKRPEQARSWIAYWNEMRGVPAASFILSEYLPGRDFSCQGVWKDGTLILVKTAERLSYFGGGNNPSGTSSVSQLAKTVFAPRVVEVCVAAIRAIGPEHFMLSSDAGIPLLPQTVEAYRLLAAMLRAYGMTSTEMRQLMTGSAKEMLTLSS